MEHDNPNRLVDRTEVEDTWGIPKRFLENAVLRGGGPRIVRIGRLVRYRIKDIEAWIEANASREDQ